MKNSSRVSISQLMGSWFSIPLHIIRRIRLLFMCFIETIRIDFGRINSRA